MGQTFFIAEQLRELVPEAQPEISQIRSVWYRGGMESVLKGRWNGTHTLHPSFHRPFRTDAFARFDQTLACLANFHSRSATARMSRKQPCP
jgi:hypothetical protein